MKILSDPISGGTSSLMKRIKINDAKLIQLRSICLFVASHCQGDWQWEANMKISFEGAMQRVADRIEAASGNGSEEKLYLSQVIEAVDSLEADGHPLEYLLANQDLIAQRLSQLSPGSPTRIGVSSV
ncbi:MAG: hypothetical protein U1E67_11390 [Hyphomicrobiales bacterium]